MNETVKRRWRHAEAQAVAVEICGLLAPVTSRLIIAGSLRRGKGFVSDAEILFIGRTERRQNPIDLFELITVDLATEAIDGMLRSGLLTKRLSKIGTTAWGEKNKLAVHAASGVPVDLFAATEATWWNQLVCRTGPADSNERICCEAIRRGWHWEPYGIGFHKAGTGERVAMASERDVFEFVGLPFKEPKDRS